MSEYSYTYEGDEIIVEVATDDDAIDAIGEEPQR